MKKIPGRDPDQKYLNYLLKKNLAYKRAKKISDRKGIECKAEPLTKEEESDLAKYLKEIHTKTHPKK